MERSTPRKGTRCSRNRFEHGPMIREAGADQPFVAPAVSPAIQYQQPERMTRGWGPHTHVKAGHDDMGLGSPESRSIGRPSGTHR
jgi:hypothetical protein